MYSVRSHRRVVALACVLGALLTGTALAAGPAWTTYRHDSARSGIDPDSSAPVAPSQDWQVGPLDGRVYGQPLVYGSRVYVATENDTVYALDAASGAIVWQRHVATAVPSGQLGCGDISPTVGITSTPVIDPATGRIYVVADTWSGSTIVHDMYALNLSDGTLGAGPISVEPPGDTPKDQLQRASLALDAGKVIVGYGGNDGDCGSYHGWLVAVPEGGGPLQSFEVDAATSQGAIWGSGNAPAIDSAGNIWTSTGNGSGGFGYQESVVKLDWNLNVLDWWAPSNWSSLDSSDTDLGSSMPVLLPSGLVFQIGKAGVGYLLNASSLGHSNTAAPVYSSSVCSGSWGGAIYVNGVIYVTCSNGLHALSLNTTSRTFQALPGWTVNGNVNGPPTFAGGLVWAVNWSGASLYGLNPSTGASTFSASLTGFEHFSSPSAGGGRLFMVHRDPSGSGDDVTAFQVATPPGVTPTTLSLNSSNNPAAATRSVTFTATVAPDPDGGTISFSDGGMAIPGCTGISISASGSVTCTTSFTRMGRYGIWAAYSGDAFFGGSAGALSESIKPNIPTLSHLAVRVHRRKLRLSLTLSRPAQVLIVVAKLVPGHVTRRGCRAGAAPGRRCTVPERTLTLRMKGRSARNRFRPRMRGLAPGRYRVTVTALDPSGGRSRPQSVLVTVR